MFFVLSGLLVSGPAHMQCLWRRADETRNSASPNCYYKYYNIKLSVLSQVHTLVIPGFCT
jgi:hypothetical protein